MAALLLEWSADPEQAPAPDRPSARELATTMLSGEKAAAAKAILELFEKPEARAQRVAAMMPAIEKEEAALRRQEAWMYATAACLALGVVAGVSAGGFEGLMAR